MTPLSEGRTLKTVGFWIHRKSFGECLVARVLSCARVPKPAMGSVEVQRPQFPRSQIRHTSGLWYGYDVWEGQGPLAGDNPAARVFIIFCAVLQALPAIHQCYNRRDGRYGDWGSQLSPSPAAAEATVGVGAFAAGACWQQNGRQKPPKLVEASEKPGTSAATETNV